MTRSTAILPVLFFLLIPLVPRAFAGDLLRAADPWCPYNCEEADPHPGFMVEMARQVFEKHGIRVTYVTVPWAHAIYGTRTGQYDGIIGAGRIDALIEDRAVFRYYLHTTGMPDEFAEAGTAGMEKIYVAFSPELENARRFADMLTKGMTALRESGALLKILNSYGLEYWDEAEK
ncbi:MAG: transporter substrate-binding domain-containing protein [Desulfotignum sp.]|nr:transporter substrate-binding domain-containing protein [Desulfotignum sp.]MCF8090381.1 transporter substrate-binding domain-containing protein [Desulfotignum sp.]MCF8138692.1 transporter substrate-binding domain-containing protein [Desulfotignum sp.]